ncbi:solute carrier family 35 member [Acrasis kona]|uniref:Solute carrier family 35 member n=1 Tax=Acrasis kona TaxID=1008807 RepID=A0AAW2YXU4_9EUKA
MAFKKKAAEYIKDNWRTVLFKSLRLLGLIIFSQILVLLLTSTGVFSEYLSGLNINIPTLQNTFNYALLVIAYVPILLVYKIRYQMGWNIKWWMYAFIAFADVEGNYLVVLAYRYTTITSIMLLNCFTIPCVMVLSRIFLKRRYNWTHVVGAIICLIGLATLIINDVLNPSKLDVNQLIGDVCCLIGAVLYAISNVSQEFVIKRQEQSSSGAVVGSDPETSEFVDDVEVEAGMALDEAQPKFSWFVEFYHIVEYLSMIGLFGGVINTIQLFALEFTQIREVKWGAGVAGYLIGFGVCLFLFYSLVPFLIHSSSATFMNLSFLSSGAWALLASIFIFKKEVGYLFYIAFAVILVGLITYNVIDEEEYTKKVTQQEVQKREEQISVDESSIPINERVVE